MFVLCSSRVFCELLGGPKHPKKPQQSTGKKPKAAGKGQAVQDRTRVPNGNATDHSWDIHPKIRQASSPSQPLERPDDVSRPPSPPPPMSEDRLEDQPSPPPPPPPPLPSRPPSPTLSSPPTPPPMPPTESTRTSPARQASAHGLTNGKAAPPLPGNVAPHHHPALTGTTLPLGPPEVPTAGGFWDPTEGYRRLEDEEMLDGDAVSGPSEDMDVSMQGTQPPSGAPAGGKGSDSPLFEVPNEDAELPPSMHTGKLNGLHQKGPAPIAPRISNPMLNQLPPGLIIDSIHPVSMRQTGSRLQTSSMDSDLPPGLDPEDMPLGKTLPGNPQRAGKPQDVPAAVVDIPGIGTVASEMAAEHGLTSRLVHDHGHLRELSRSPILANLFPYAAVAQGLGSRDSPALIEQQRLSSSSLTSSTSQFTTRSVSPAVLPAGQLPHMYVQNGEAYANHANPASQGRAGSPDASIPNATQQGLIPVHPGAVPTQPAGRGIQAAAAAASDANGLWHTNDFWQNIQHGHERDPQSGAQQSPTGGVLNADSLRPQSALGRPQQPAQDLSLLGDSVDVLLQ